MVVIETRDAAYDTAFELLDEAMHNAKKTKLTLCELEDAMYDCYEASKDDEQEDYEPETELEYRSRGGYRHDDLYDDDDEEKMRMRLGMRRMSRRSRSRLRMRRNRMGRFV